MPLKYRFYTYFYGKSIRILLNPSVTSYTLRDINIIAQHLLKLSFIHTVDSQKFQRNFATLVFVWPNN